MKKIKTWIIFIIILILLIIASLIIIKMNNRKNSSDNSETEFETKVNYEADQEIVKETNRNQYYTVMNIANSFISAMIDGGSETLFNMLNPQYASENSITKDNAYEKINCLEIGELDEYQLDNLNVKMKIKNMYRTEKSANIKSYFIYGIIQSNISDIQKDYNLIVQIDSKNNTFYIIPNEYIEEQGYDKIENLNNYSVDFEVIEENDYNTFNFVNIDDSRIINDYLVNYKEAIVNNVEESYNLLNEEYRKEKFETYEQYKQYVEENNRDLLSISFTKYKKEEGENETEYICIDKNNNYYIFKETAIMEYEIYLDDYTVDLPEFQEKYDKLDSTKKVGMNVEKIVKAINKKDYNYIYKKLDEQFVANNFATKEAFKNYMNEKYSNIYEVEHHEVQEENGTYVESINLISDDEVITASIIMQLKEGTDFVMSFGIE